MNENRIKKVMSKVFKVDINSVDENASPDTIESWDSLKHMELILALEEEFNVELTPEETVEILSYKLIKITLKDHGILFD
jgi:acyl carrier protein